jgi:uncharacterized protein (TIGR02452 family)
MININSSLNQMSHSSIQSFDGWLQNSPICQHDQEAVRKSFVGLTQGTCRWEDFQHTVHSTTQSNQKLERRVLSEASNAYHFPQVGRFYRWLNDNEHLSPDRKKAISGVVRNTLYSETKAAIPTICSQIKTDLIRTGQKKNFHKGWEGNISFVMDKLLNVLASTPLHQSQASALLNSGEASTTAEQACSTSTSVQTYKQAIFHNEKTLIHIFNETQQASQHGYIVNGICVKIDPTALSTMQKGTTIYQHCPHFVGIKNRFMTQHNVVNKDSLCAAKDLIDQGERPLVLNLANAQSPGGGVQRGSKAQEEDIMRCSNYSFALFPWLNPSLAAQLPQSANMPKYRIPETGAIFTPRVTVFRDSSSNYAFLNKPFEVDMLASAAYNLKPGHWGGPMHSIGPKGIVSKAKFDFENGTKEKIRTQLTVAANLGATCLVLGAFGCGAFANKPEDISRWYKEILENEFPGVFKTVTFAVLGNAGPGLHNFNVFSSKFASQKRPFNCTQPASATDEKEINRLMKEIQEDEDLLQTVLSLEGVFDSVDDLQQNLIQKKTLLDQLLNGAKEPALQKRKHS